MGNDANRLQDDVDNDDDNKDARGGKDGKPVLYPTRYFGKGLRLLRHSYGERMAAQDPFAPAIRARISTAALVECMRRANYTIKVAAFNEIEHGMSAPRDAQVFLAAVRSCLRLRQEDVEDLERRLAYDILYARLGERARVVLPPSPKWDEEPAQPAKQG